MPQHLIRAREVLEAGFRLKNLKFQGEVAFKATLMYCGNAVANVVDYGSGGGASVNWLAPRETPEAMEALLKVVSTASEGDPNGDPVDDGVLMADLVVFYDLFRRTKTKVLVLDGQNFLAYQGPLDEGLRTHIAGKHPGGIILNDVFGLYSL